MENLSSVRENWKEFRKDCKDFAEFKKEPDPYSEMPTEELYAMMLHETESAPSSISYFFFWLEGKTWMFQTIKFYIKGLHCVLFGHDYVDEGWATPESGCIDLVCQRCGKPAGKHYLY